MTPPPASSAPRAISSAPRAREHQAVSGGGGDCAAATRGVASDGVEVPLVTVDAILQMFPFRRSGDAVDFLSIDNEGHDSLVLLGASQGIGRRAFRVIEFEYHKVGMWARTSLNDDTVVALRNHRYRCYWQG